MCYAGVFERAMERYTEFYGAEAADHVLERFHLRQTHEPKSFKEDQRTYPHTYAPVMHRDSRKLVYEPMRYGVYLPQWVSKKGTDYNARRDNIAAPYWSEAFRVNHGFVVIKEFNESVDVKDLVTGGVISMDDVRAFFAAKKALRKAKVEATGKKYKETETEKKDPLERSIEIIITPDPPVDLLVPVIYSTTTLADGFPDCGFAIVTDESSPEIMAAGKDRKPATLTREAIDQWLEPDDKNFRQLDDILGQHVIYKYSYALPKVGD